MKRRKYLSLLTAVFLVLSLLPLGAFADTELSETVYSEKDKSVENTGGFFQDMPDNWSTAALSQAVANGLLKGYEESGKTYIKADNFLTRGEMAAVVNRVFGSLAKDSLKEVTDVPASAWYAGDIYVE